MHGCPALSLKFIDTGFSSLSRQEKAGVAVNWCSAAGQLLRWFLIHLSRYQEWSMSRAQSRKIKNCRVELKWREPLDWWLICSPTNTSSFKKPIGSASEPNPFLYIYHHIV